MAKASPGPRKAPRRTTKRRGMGAVCVRAAAPGDRDVLAELRREAERTHARLMPDYFREAPPEAAGAWEPDDGPWSAVLVADVGGEVCGFVAVKVVVTPRDPAMVPRRRAHVEVVVVAPSRRRVGIGAALMRGATEWAAGRGAEEMVLTVWAANRAAEALYRRLGYRPIARIMRRRL